MCWPLKAAMGQHPSSRAFPGHSPAYDLYVRGKIKAGSENIEDTENAIKVLEAAIAIDPFFAPAYAQLARAYNTRAFKFSAGPKRKLLHENADVAVEKALSLDPNLAEGHFARGLILWTNTKGFPHEQAIRAFKRVARPRPRFGRGTSSIVDGLCSRRIDRRGTSGIGKRARTKSEQYDGRVFGWACTSLTRGNLTRQCRFSKQFRVT